MLTIFFAQVGRSPDDVDEITLCNIRWGSCSQKAKSDKTDHIVIIPSQFVYCSEVKDGFHMGPLRTFQQMLGCSLEMQQNVTLSNPS